MFKISIIIPVYNVEKYIERCVRSLFEQTLDDIEFIFVDDASPDNSIQIIKSILEEFPKRKESVFFVKHDTNKGLAAARKSGLEIASGEYIAHCDSDDWVDKNMYKTIYDEAKIKNADIGRCDFFFAYQDQNIEVKHSMLSLQDYIVSGMTPVWNMIVRRSLYAEHNISPTIGINYCEDFILSVKLLYKAKRIIHVDKALYYYNQQNTNSLLRTRKQEAESEEVKAYLDVIDFFKRESIYDIYEKQLCWRMLRAKQEWILYPQFHEMFLSTYPECHKYIWSCPMINRKLKLMMWSKIHHMSFITNYIVLLRKIFRR